MRLLCNQSGGLIFTVEDSTVQSFLESTLSRELEIKGLNSIWINYNISTRSTFEGVKHNYTHWSGIPGFSGCVGIAVGVYVYTWQDMSCTANTNYGVCYKPLDCPPNSTVVLEHGICFWTTTVRKFAVDAHLDCMTDGGGLAVIPNEEVSKILTIHSGLFIYAKNTDGEGFHMWLGVNDICSEGMYKTFEGENVHYTGWASGEPSDENRATANQVNDSSSRPPILDTNCLESTTTTSNASITTTFSPTNTIKTSTFSPTNTMTTPTETTTNTMTTPTETTTNTIKTSTETTTNSITTPTETTTSTISTPAETTTSTISTPAETTTSTISTPTETTTSTITTSTETTTSTTTTPTETTTNTNKTSTETTTNSITTPTEMTTNTITTPTETTTSTITIPTETTTSTITTPTEKTTSTISTPTESTTSTITTPTEKTTSTISTPTETTTSTITTTTETTTSTISTPTESTTSTITTPTEKTTSTISTPTETTTRPTTTTVSVTSTTATVTTATNSSIIISTTPNPTTSEITTADTTQTVESSTQNAMPCFCRSQFFPANVSVKQLVESIREEMLIDTKLTSSYRRSLVCADDPRPTSKYIGTTAVTIMTILCCCFVFPDVVNIFRAVVQFYKRTT
ncbi:flocculation protein FLO11-like [Mizuhopecten yessoensis]|uniref:flocculation protein FLO11-like n=1 Tax=Mizuhopecten yessoensis TaxID=6573 RepID=UPI000B45D93E|nr:flocculation protein FLO11-like [Mizuhopecten yessoensis]